MSVRERQRGVFETVNDAHVRRARACDEYAHCTHAARTSHTPRSGALDRADCHHRVLKASAAWSAAHTIPLSPNPAPQLTTSVP